MKKEEFITKMKRIGTIRDYHKRTLEIKKFLLTQMPFNKCAYTSNKEAYEKYCFLKKHFTSYTCKENNVINFKNVIGGKHCDYIDYSPVRMIISDAKRMRTVYDHLSSTPEYFFGTKNETQSDNITYAAFIDSDGKKKYIATEGNHRTAMGLYLRSLLLFDEINIDNVGMVEYEIDYARISLIENSQKLLNSFGYELMINYDTVYVKNSTYKIITSLYIQSDTLDFNSQFRYLGRKEFHYKKDTLKKDIIKNDENINKYLKNVLCKVPKHIRLQYGFKNITRSIKECVKTVKA